MAIKSKQNYTNTRIVFCNSLDEVRQRLGPYPVTADAFDPLRTCWNFDASALDQIPLSRTRKTYLAMDDFFGERDMRIALVASDDLNFGMCRMLASFIERPYRLAMTFRDAADAIEWLSV